MRISDNEIDELRSNGARLTALPKPIERVIANHFDEKVSGIMSAIKGIQPPDVVVNVPETKPPVVNVMPDTRKRKFLFTLKRDSYGKLTSITAEEQ